MNISSDRIYTNPIISTDSKTGNTKATSTLTLPNGQKVTVTLQYDSKNVPKDQINQDLQKSIDKTVSLSIAYQLGTKTQSLTLKGDTLIKEYTSKGLAERNANRKNKGKEELTESTQTTQLTDEKLQAKLIKSPAYQDKRVQNFFLNQHRSNPDLSMRQASHHPQDIQSRNIIIEESWASKIKGSDNSPKNVINETIENLYNKIAESIPNSSECPNKKNPKERANHAKELTRELIVLMEEHHLSGLYEKGVNFISHLNVASIGSDPTIKGMLELGLSNIQEHLEDPNITPEVKEKLKTLEQKFLTAIEVENTRANA